MHSIGDKIMYGAAGVMTIVDIREEAIGDVPRSYFVLRPTLARTDSYTFVPVDNERLVSSMRPLMTRDEVLSLIRSFNEIEPLRWIPENRARQDYFKRVMESGDRRDMVAMIRAINDNAVRREAEGKKNFLSDENAKIKTQRLLYSEFSVVLDIPEEEIDSFIEENLRQ